MQNVSQQEFIDKIHELNQMLIEAWNTNQKVKALKIAIQVLVHNSIVNRRVRLTIYLFY